MGVGSPANGETRSRRQAAYLLQTPDTFVRTPVPEVTRGAVIVHASPALGAEFVWMTVELERGGSLTTRQHSRFFYVLEGEGTLGSPEGDSGMTVGEFAYAPPGAARTLTAIDAMRCVVIAKQYEPWPDAGFPRELRGRESALASQRLEECPGIEVRCLLPLEPCFDFAVNTMTYAAGAALPQVEIHYMEHGLLMLAGSGTYRLGKDVHRAEAGDFIWMEAYCPQWFQADADEPAKYLIYKNFNRMPLL